MSLFFRYQNFLIGYLKMILRLDDKAQWLEFPMHTTKYNSDSIHKIYQISIR